MDRGSRVDVLGKLRPAHDCETTAEAVTSPDVTPICRSPGTAASVTVVVATPSSFVAVSVSWIVSSVD